MPVIIKYTKQKNITVLDKDETLRKAEKYKNAYEAEAAGKKIRNMAIAFLLILLTALVVVTVKSKYSVFTYFTDYKSDMENELIDKYENWEKTLEERQEELDRKEKDLEKKQNNQESDNK